ncbi:uncharacterized protein GIQ15_00396 [Arthroderma uncinatum]|uniref:uncharacterized protein n=1 Tax=Arthroderma uncinatum TaxID=74035 RepID=UPI00144A74B8|nr:uncharacterized protein GIQ15_00396 [Arthroderma uncinatum]KAF3490879.1 hypothetical protein GIQ15_00396 [Arthroderma uncinatum]
MAASTVSVLGLGEMGAALASAFVSNSHPTTVWNRTVSKATDLVQRGAILASSPAECIRASSELVVVCLVNHDAVKETLLSEATLAALEGKTLVNLTNGTPAQAREMASLVAAHRVEYIHGGIMAVPSMIGTPAAFILYSSSSSTFESVESTLGVLGRVNFVSGEDVGRASLLDMALLSGMYGMFSGAVHAIALAKSSGMPGSEFARDLLVPWLSAMAQSVGRLGQEADEGRYPSGGSGLGMQVAAMPNLVAASREAGVWEGMLLPIMGLMERRVAAGGVHEGLGALVEEMCR